MSLLALRISVIALYCFVTLKKTDEIVARPTVEQKAGQDPRRRANPRHPTLVDVVQAPDGESRSLRGRLGQQLQPNWRDQSQLGSERLGHVVSMSIPWGDVSENLSRVKVPQSRVFIVGISMLQNVGNGHLLLHKVLLIHGLGHGA